MKLTTKNLPCSVTSNCSTCFNLDFIKLLEATVAELTYPNAPEISIVAACIWRCLHHQSESFKLSIASVLFSPSDDCL